MVATSTSIMVYLPSDAPLFLSHILHIQDILGTYLRHNETLPRADVTLKDLRIGCSVTLSGGAHRGSTEPHPINTNFAPRQQVDYGAMQIRCHLQQLVPAQDFLFALILWYVAKSIFRS